MWMWWFLFIRYYLSLPVFLLCSFFKKKKSLPILILESKLFHQNWNEEERNERWAVHLELSQYGFSCFTVNYSLGKSFHTSSLSVASTTCILSEEWTTWSKAVRPPLTENFLRGSKGCKYNIGNTSLGLESWFILTILLPVQNI